MHTEVLGQTTTKQPQLYPQLYSIPKSEIENLHAIQTLQCSLHDLLRRINIKQETNEKANNVPQFAKYQNVHQNNYQDHR